MPNKEVPQGRGPGVPGGVGDVAENAQRKKMEKQPGVHFEVDESKLSSEVEDANETYESEVLDNEGHRNRINKNKVPRAQH